MKSKYVLIATVTIIAISTLCFGIPLILGGYYYRDNLNKYDLVPTVCTVINHNVTYTGQGRCDDNRRTWCNKYALYYIVQYSVKEDNSNLFNSTLKYDSDYEDSKIADGVLRVNRPLNSSSDCYYSKHMIFIIPNMTLQVT